MTGQRQWKAGQIVSWDLHDGAATVRVTSVSPTGYNPSISYESSDGHSEIMIESTWRSLADLTRRWRPATEDEQARFLTRYTPAPQNWH